MKTYSEKLTKHQLIMQNWINSTVKLLICKNQVCYYEFHGIFSSLSFQNSKNAFMNSLKKRLKDCCLHSSKMNLHFIKFSDHVTDTVHPDTIPVLLESPGTSLKFNIDEYIRNLQTKELGQTVLHGDVVTSTMPFVDS